MKTPNPVDKHVGNRLRMRRLMLGMSQEKLAEAFRGGLTTNCRWVASEGLDPDEV